MKALLPPLPLWAGIAGAADPFKAGVFDPPRAAPDISATCRMADGSRTDYTVHHSPSLYFVDRQGMQRALMPFGHPAADIAPDLRLLLQ